MSDNPRIEELRRRVQKDPASIAFAQLAEEYRRAGDHDEAVRVCRAGLAKHPSYLSARVTLGRALIELAQYDEAHTELDYVLRSAPENLAAIRGLAEISQRRGDLAEALKQYQMALGIAKHDPELEEAVEQLTRQLGGTLPARPQARVHEKPEVRASDTVTPPPIPAIEDAPAGTSSNDEAAFAANARPAALDTFEPAPPPPASKLTPELEAAADEFTRALEALDALTIDVPAPALNAESFDLAPVLTPEDDRLVPAQDWEQAGFDAAAIQVSKPPVDSAADATLTIPEPAAPAPGPDPAAIADLQNWLDNIVLDRTTPAKR